MSAVRPDIGVLLAPGDADAPGLATALSRLLGFHHRTLGGVAADARLIEAATRALVAAHALGHACLPLEEIAPIAGVTAAGLRAALAASPVVLTIDAGALVPAGAVAPPERPLVLDDAGRLYLARHFDSERRLAIALHALASAGATVRAFVDADATAALIASLFTGLADNPAQRDAVRRVLAERFVVITGGPGTGKTTTVARCIAAVLEAEPDARVLLAAPTGKAAARMNDAIASQLDLLPAGLNVLRRRLPPARTVHALLGLVPGKADAIRHHAGRPLDADLVVVDEVSMLGLTLARRLADAVRPGARLVLLGDPDQLASVETGLVLAELAAGDDPPLPDAIARLSAGQRFAADSAIGRLATAVRRADATAVRAALNAAAPAVTLDTRALGGDALARQLIGLFAPTLDALAGAHPDAASEANASAVLAAFERGRVLCAVHDGPRGTRALNAALGRLAAAQLAAAGRADAIVAGDWPHGRPLLVTRNDPGTGLANGDIGVVLHDADGVRAWFRIGDALKSFPVARLPACETAWALSIHKSQGSEFDRVEIVLPALVDGAHAQTVLTRELLYTAITRARRELRLWSGEAMLDRCIAQGTRRHSGLGDRLRALARQ